MVKFLYRCKCTHKSLTLKIYEQQMVNVGSLVFSKSGCGNNEMNISDWYTIDICNWIEPDGWE